MSETGGKRATALLVATVVLAMATPVLAQTPSTGGRKGKEFRVPIRSADKRGIRVVLVSQDEVGLPVLGAPAQESLGSVTPSFGGGMTRPPTTGAGAAGPPGNSLFEQLVVPAAGSGAPAPDLGLAGGMPASRSAPPHRAGATPATSTGAVANPYASGSRVASPGPALDDRVQTGQSGRPAVRVVSGGSGRIHVLPPNSAGGAAPVHSGTPSVAGAPGFADGGVYRIGAGDVLDVFVWRNEELNRRLPVRPDGLISLPLVGEVRAAGLSAVELQERIASMLGEFIQQPAVTITVAEIKSLVIYVLGNVSSPGTVVMDRNLTTLQAIAMAGGLTEFADRNDIVVLRTDETGAQRRFSFRYDDVVEGRDLGTNLLLRAGDVIYVP